jgi:hydroxyethylthiazole kinase-like uncharacterized protein yjeF
MQRIDPLRRSWPIHSRDATRAIEQRELAILPPYTLMQRAGDGVARLALAVAPQARRVWVAAGPGNNGGDGLAAAAALARAGRSVSVTLLSDPERLPADAAAMWSGAQSAGVTMVQGPPATLAADDLAIDALLGIGASRAPSGRIAASIDDLNALPCGVLAIDLPSGLHPDTGQPFGERIVRASHTLSLLTLKPGLVTGQGRDQAGMLWLDTLGIRVDDAAQAMLAGGPALAGHAILRRHAQHKGSFGDVHVVGGARTMVGAALLAARAAHASGAGRVYVALLDEEGCGVDSERPELMFRPAWWLRPAPEIAASTVVCGCGGGPSVRDVLPPLLAHASRLVLDADALNAIGGDIALQSQLRARAARERPTVLTPHPLEAGRLLGMSSKQVQADRLAAARQLADRYACAVVLKGSGTIIAAPQGLPQINPTGSAALATAGTGDVLAGWIGGLWAQHGSTSTEVAIEVATRSVFCHGLAADRAQQMPLRAADLIAAMMRARDASAPLAR